MSRSGWLAAVAVLLVGCAAPVPEPVISVPPVAAESTPAPVPRERDALEVALDAAWDGDPHRFGCGGVMAPIVDALADTVQTVVETDRLSAVVAAQQYRRERCPGR